MAERLRCETISERDYIEGDLKVHECVKVYYTKSGRPYEIHGRTTRPLHPDPEKVKRFLKTARKLADELELKWALEAEEKRKQQALPGTE